MREHPIAPGRSTIAGRTVLECKPVHVPDIQADPEYTMVEAQRLGGFRTMLGVPLMRAGAPIGVMTVLRNTVDPFTDKQIELITTFADQAVIAIENTRLFEAEQARTRELQAAFDRQSATAEVLGVISRSPSETKPVFDAIVSTAARLCRAEHAIIFRRASDDRFHVAATNNAEAEWLRWITDNPLPPGRGSVAGRVALEGKVVHVPDCLADPEFILLDHQRVGKFRTMLGVPLLRECVCIGVIGLLRNVVQPFSDVEIDLVTTFADQAVIAIENARLFQEVQARNTELRMALEQQTATSELLKVIGGSTFGIQPVFETLAENAVRLCEAERSFIFRFDG